MCTSILTQKISTRNPQVLISTIIDSILNFYLAYSTYAISVEEHHQLAPQPHYVILAYMYRLDLTDVIGKKDMVL